MSPDASMELFPSRPERAVDPRAPLADRMRPARFEDLIGQEHLVAAGSALRAMLEADQLSSLILWGPPGTGKTSLAWLLAARADSRMLALSAVVAGVKEIREAIESARRTRLRTLLFIDEIHRLNRAQQDVLLPHVEAGVVTLVGATTENPSFTVNAPLLSRCRVLCLQPLDDEALRRVVERALHDAERGLGASGLALAPEAVSAIVHASDGDARRALGLLETAAAIHRQSARPGSVLEPETIREAAGRRLLLHDRDRDEHYNVVSALIKSLRASDPDAALYYMARMLSAGEDPLFVARRLLVFASEDVGNADPWALTLALSCFQAVERLGMPEARIPLAQATSYLACAVKSNAAYAALGRAEEAVTQAGSAPVPLHLRNAPTRLLEDLGCGRDYRYPHDAPEAFVPDWNLPDAVGEACFYRPSERGAEAALARRLEAWRLRRRRNPAADETPP